MNDAWNGIVRHFVHDIRSLLRRSTISAQLLERRLNGTDPEMSELLSAVISGQQDVENLLRRVSRLAEAMRGETPPRRMALETALKLAIQNSWKGAVQEDGSNLEVRRTPQFAVPGLFQTAVEELVDNTVRFRPENRPLVVVVDGSIDESGGLILTVSDNGEGWDERYTGKVFRPFETLDTRRRGAGVGLAICKAVAENCGGTIEAATSPAGTTITMAIPV